MAKKKAEKKAGVKTGKKYTLNSLIEALEDIRKTFKGAGEFEVIYGSADGVNCDFGLVVNNPDVGRFLPKGDGYTGKIDWNSPKPNAVCVN